MLKNSKKFVVLFLIIIFLAVVFGIYFGIKNRIINREPRDFLNREKVLDNRRELPLEKVKALRLDRLSRDGGLRGLNETDQYVEGVLTGGTGDNLANNQISNYQTFVTPQNQAVTNFAKGKNYQKIYDEALSWVWVEDDIINGTEEKWLYPETFLVETPTMKTNPVLNRIASDCESQAYTLVSALRAAGMSAEEVRVITGKVNFGRGAVGGHAWVEVYDQTAGRWFQLEATSGDFYDSQTGKLVESPGMEYNYFKNYKYPSVAKWTMFNDKYFFDITRGQGVVPDSWFDDDTLDKQEDPNNIDYTLPDALKKLREERADSLREELLKITQGEFQERAEYLRSRRVQSTQSGMTGAGYSEEEITQQIIKVIEQLEEAIKQGATEEQKIMFQKAAEEGIKKAYQMLASSNLSEEEKEELYALLEEAERLLDEGLSQAQIALLKKEALDFLDQLKKDVESGEARETLKEKREEIRQQH